MIKIKKHLNKIIRLNNYTDRSKFLLNLDRNENITGFSKSQIKDFYKHLSKKKINYYPNLKDSYQLLSNFLKIDVENLLFTEGVSGAIKNILDALSLTKKSEIVYPNPSFALYNIYEKIYNVKGKVYGYDKNFKLDYDKILSLINKNTAVVFLPIPNIPLEGDINLKKIIILIKKLRLKNILLAVDEVYHPFGKGVHLSLVKKYKNLVIMRSFSKAYGLAGARIGFIVSSKDNIKVFNICKGGYETNILSVSAVEFIIKNIKIVKEYIKSIKLGLKFLKKELKKLGLVSFGGDSGNFVLINFSSKFLAKKIYKKLLKNKISVRYGFQNIFDKSLLITLAPLKEMKIFVSNLKKII